MLIVEVPDKLIADGFQIVDEHGFLVAVGDRFVDVLPQNIPMGELSALLDPVQLFAAAVERRVFQNRLVKLAADLVGYLS